MKSLHKTFDILEYVILRNGKKVLPSEAAEALDINLATCTRIMGELVKRGYLEKVSRKSGYIAGPMIVSLNTRNQLYKRIADAAAEPVRQLSEALNCQVNIAVLNQAQRVMLAFHLADYPVFPWQKFRFEDHWDTATGRLLLATLEKGEAKAICKSAGITPFPADYFEQLRKDGFVRFAWNDLCIIGHLIRVPGYPPAAFGFGVPPQQADRALELSAAAALKISVKLTMPVCQAF